MERKTMKVKEENKHEIRQGEVKRRRRKKSGRKEGRGKGREGEVNKKGKKSGRPDRHV